MKQDYWIDITPAETIDIGMQEVTLIDKSRYMLCCYIQNCTSRLLFIQDNFVFFLSQNTCEGCRGEGESNSTLTVSF